jgi:hypothetical protein
VADDDATIEVDVDHIFSTDKAVLVGFEDRHGRREVWIPRSTVITPWDEIEAYKRREAVTIEIKEWIAAKNGLV